MTKFYNADDFFSTIEVMCAVFKNSTGRDATALCLTAETSEVLYHIVEHRLDPRALDSFRRFGLQQWLTLYADHVPKEIAALVLFWNMPEFKVCSVNDVLRPEEKDLSAVTMEIVRHKTELVTPDQYRYAKAHLRAALDHMRLATHYMRGDPVTVILDNHACTIQDLHDYAEKASKP